MTGHAAVLAGFFLLLCGTLYLFLMLQEERIPNLPPPEEETELLQCPICAYIYAFQAADEFSNCPRCKTINRKGEKCFR